MSVSLAVCTTSRRDGPTPRRMAERHSDRGGGIFLTLRRGVGLVVGRAVAHQPIEMHPNVSGFRGRISERDGPAEGETGLLGTTELHQQRPFHPEEVEVTRQ